MSKAEAQKLFDSCQTNMPTGLQKYFSEAFKVELDLVELNSSTGLTEDRALTGRLITK